ncbi:MurR/RpiR family transcriptional regulator [Curtobacterium sp. A7_M15]|uniref:MurR/RpiR family transcriptional regulator n=1 Tax=Curtobacterium sp. A7_M15 TaxID=3065241 RepID=UPI0035203586
MTVGEQPRSVGVSIRTSIQSGLDGYPPSMRRVAEAILRDPRVVLEQTITELARTCETSETSVVRFCRTLGFTGYAPFRLQMAAELASESAQFGDDPLYGDDAASEDSIAGIVQAISHAEIVGIQETAAALDLDVLRTVIDRVAAASQVALFGVAASNAAATDLAQKLRRVRITAMSFVDAHDALVPATLLGAGGVAIAFSHSGRTREAVEFLNAARRSGAFAVAITSTLDSPLAQASDAALRTAVRETTFRSGAMASRIAQLTIVDYLFVGVARVHHERSINAISDTRAAVQALRDPR